MSPNFIFVMLVAALTSCAALYGAAIEWHVSRKSRRLVDSGKMRAIRPPTNPRMTAS